MGWSFCPHRLPWVGDSEWECLQMLWYVCLQTDYFSPSHTQCPVFSFFLMFTLHWFALWANKTLLISCFFFIKLLLVFTYFMEYPKFTVHIICWANSVQWTSSTVCKVHYHLSNSEFSASFSCFCHYVINILYKLIIEFTHIWHLFSSLFNLIYLIGGLK